MKVCPVCQREFPAGATTCSEDGVPLVALVTDVGSRPEDLVGKIVEGRYKIERIIGKGGMGTVYACRHVVVGKIAAMKVLKAGGERTDGVLQRFVREAQTANLLKSRHIVEVSDFGQLQNGSFFVVMELLEGQDLAKAMRAGLNRQQLVHIFMQVAETLQLAHDMGIVHRDLKPDNVFLVNEGGDPHFVKLLDFGIAKILHGDGPSSLTETGVILGTPYYMSPEQARAEAIDHRSDIYALGVMMYRAFTGRLPFIADSTMGVLTRHITEDPQPPSLLGNVDQVTEAMILRCMAKRREHRFQTMREVAAALASVPGAAGASPAQAAYPAQVTAQSAQARTAQTGAYAQASAQYAQVPSGQYAQAPSGQYAAVGTPSGQYVQVASGQFPPLAASGAHPQITGAQQAYPQAYPQTATTSGSYPQAGTYDARVSSAPGNGYTAARTAASAILSTMPSAQPAPVLEALASTPGGPPPEPTTRGVAATSHPQASRAPSAVLMVVGALAMAAAGAAAAFFIWRPGPTPAGAGTGTGTAASSTAPIPSAAPPAGSATGASAATAPPPTTSGTAAEPATTGKGRTGHVAPPPPPPPKATATATATAAPTSKTPRDIRSPFE